MKKFIVIGLIIFILIGGAIFLFSDFFNQEEMPEEGLQAINDLQITLDSILGRTDADGYIFGFPTDAGALISDDEIAGKINAAITYEIVDVQIEDTGATATIFISAPDLSIILADVVSRLVVDENDDIDELLSQVRLTLNSDHEMFEDTVEVRLELLNGNWFLIPNAEFSNALSGNLIQLYARMIDEFMDELVGGSNDE